MIQQHAGAVGFGVTTSTGFVGLVSTALPLLQAVSLTVSIIVGLLTAVWYVRRLLNDR